jgi:hypothetical protein
MATLRPGGVIDALTLEELEAVPLERGRPLVAIDADEVLVEFAGHLTRWLKGVGYEMRLERYALEGAIFPLGEEFPVGFDGAIALIDAFFEEETERQTALEGAVEAVGRLARDAQVVVLTNVPRHARAARAENLAALGLDLPLVANVGGKGRAIGWLAERAAAPAVFVDDSPSQIASAARHAPDVGRIHFAGSPFIAAVLPEAPEAHERVADWPACEAAIRRRLGL